MKTLATSYFLYKFNHHHHYRLVANDQTLRVRNPISLSEVTKEKGSLIAHENTQNIYFQLRYISQKKKERRKRLIKELPHYNSHNALFFHGIAGDGDISDRSLNS